MYQAIADVKYRAPAQSKQDSIEAGRGVCTVQNDGNAQTTNWP